MPFFEEAALKANTENGKGWLRKALHPPGTKDPTYNGYPDMSNRPLIHQEYRLNNEFFYSQVNSESDMLILHSPSVMNPFYVSYNNPSLPGSYDGTNSWQVNFPNDQLDQDSVVKEFGQYRQAYRSVTEQLDATAFNNAGMNYVAQFSPSTYIITVGDAVIKMAAAGNLKKFAPMFAKLNPDMSKLIAKILILFHNQTFNAETDPPHKAFKKEYEVDRIELETLRQSINLTIYAVQVVNLARPILQPSDLTNLSTKAYTARATEGAFIVSQINDNSNKWCNVRAGLYRGNASYNPGLMISMYEQTYENGTTFLYPFVKNQTNDFVYDVEWGTWTWSYSYYVGITPPTAGLVQPKVNFKTIIGIEISPTNRSILNPSATAPALYDPTALTTYCVISQSKQDGMPASMNFGGLGAMLAGTVINKGVDVMAKAIGGADSSKNELGKIEQSLANTETNGTAETPVMSGKISRPSMRDNTGAVMGSSSLSDRFSRMSVKPRQRRRSTSRARSVNRSKSRNRSYSRRRSTSRYRSSSRYRKPKKHNKKSSKRK